MGVILILLAFITFNPIASANGFGCKWSLNQPSKGSLNWNLENFRNGTKEKADGSNFSVIHTTIPALEFFDRLEVLGNRVDLAETERRMNALYYGGTFLNERLAKGVPVIEVTVYPDQPETYVISSATWTLSTPMALYELIRQGHVSIEAPIPLVLIEHEFKLTQNLSPNFHMPRPRNEFLFSKIWQMNYWNIDFDFSRDGRELFGLEFKSEAEGSPRLQIAK